MLCQVASSEMSLYGEALAQWLGTIQTRHSRADQGFL
jgi:hypothetical protein